MAKILVAEDDVTTRRMIVTAIERMGHCAIQSSNGRLAYEILENNPDIALLVTDVVMPELNGDALVAGLRDEEQFRNLPIIIMSGIVSISDIKDLLDVGASRFLGKPINVAHLRDYVKQLAGEVG